MTNAQISIKNDSDLKVFLHKNYMNQIKNFFEGEKQAMKFLSSVMSAVQRNPELLSCNPISLVNSFMTMAQLGLMPSDVSGEAYVLPYNTKNGKMAQFQLGYQGLATLFFRAGGLKIRAELVREKDEFSYENGEVQHKINIFLSNQERGKVIGAYAIATLNNGQEIAKAMNITDILRYREFSKSKASEYSPWNEKNDPEGWMYKKTVLKQLGKLLPKNENILKAIAEDNNDSIIQDRLEEAKKESEALAMGAVLKSDTADAPTAAASEEIGEAEVTVEPIVEDAPMSSTPVVEVTKDLPPEEENESPHKKAMRAGMKKAEAEKQKDPNEF